MKTRFTGRGGCWAARFSWVALLTSLFFPRFVHADDDRLGGHFGLVLPLVTVADGDATSLGDFFSIGLPIGVTVKKAIGPLAFDMEFVPTITEDHDTDVVIHPGLIYPGKFAAVGMRFAVEVDSDAYGFTPLIAKPLFKVSENAWFFAELDLPVRFPKSDVDTTFAVAAHFGISF